MARVNITSIWGSGATFLTDPGGAKVALGWINEPGIADWDNWHKNRADQALEETERRGIWIWNVTTVYFQYAVAIGSDGFMYQRTVAGAGTDPVGDVGGTWLLLGGAGPAVVPTIITASDPVWAPALGVRTLKVMVVGAGGGAGGTPGGGGGTACSIAGSGGGTAIKTIQAPLAASYAIVIGAGGAGGNGVGGSDGGDSIFGAIPVTGFGGGGGLAASLGNLVQGVIGGAASGGDINVRGAWSGTGGEGAVNGFSHSGGPYRGGGISSTADGTDGVDAESREIGVGGGAVGMASIQRVGGDGGDGVVVIEEHF